MGEKAPTVIVDLDATIVSASVRAGKIRIALKDGREVSVPLHWFPRLVAATPAQRRQVEIDPDGTALHWREIDEDIDVSAFLARDSIVVFPTGSLLISDDGSLAGKETRS